MLISILIPCYNSSKSLEQVIDLVKEEFEKQNKYTFEVVLVNDYSSDNTYEVIKKIANKYEFVKGIDLAKNFGQHNALMAAMQFAKGDIIMGMDDDLQTHPSQLFKLIDKLEEGFDIVYGKYPEKKHSFFRNLGSKFNNFTVRKLIGKPKGLTACSFWCARKYVIDEIIKYKNYNAHIQGLFLRTTSKITNVEIEHFSRQYGKSNYNLKKLLKLWGGCLNFSILPLRISFFIGIVFSMFGFIGAAYILIKKIIDTSFVAGWSSIMCVLFVFFGITLLSLGLIGEYLGRVLLSINNTPQFVIRETINIDEKK